MEDLNSKVTGSTLTAVEWNEVPSELQNVIEALGITLSSGDLNQLGKAIAGYVANGDFYTDSGAADAYVLTAIGTKQAPPAYTDGMRVRFDAANANTGGAATVNVAGLGSKSLTDEGGSAPGAGEISGNAAAVYSSSNDRFELVKSGIVKVNVITSSDPTWTPTPGAKSIKFMAIGAGGGGGGVALTATNQGASAAGGGGGALVIQTVNTLAASYALTVGAGGAGGVAGANSGSAGGATSIIGGGVNMSAGGALGGGGGTGNSVWAATIGGAGGVASGGDVGFDGSQAPRATTMSALQVSYGISGAGPFGGSVRGQGGAPGTGANTYGTGGGGAGNAGAVVSWSGGDGYQGIIIIEETF